MSWNKPESYKAPHCFERTKNVSAFTCDSLSSDWPTLARISVLFTVPLLTTKQPTAPNKMTASLGFFDDWDFRVAFHISFFLNAVVMVRNLNNNSLGGGIRIMESRYVYTILLHPEETIFKRFFKEIRKCVLTDWKNLVWWKIIFSTVRLKRLKKGLIIVEWITRVRMRGFENKH